MNVPSIFFLFFFFFVVVLLYGLKTLTLTFVYPIQVCYWQHIVCLSNKSKEQKKVFYGFFFYIFFYITKAEH